VYPALAVIQALAKVQKTGDAQSPFERDVDILFIGSKQSMEAQLVAKAQLPFAGISAGGLRGMGRAQQLRHAMSLVRGVMESWSILRKFRPHVLLATGGYVSAPAVLAARLRRTPTVIYLPDIVPGLAVRVLAPLATNVAVTAQRTARLFGNKGIATGYPVRKELREVDRAEARRRFGFRPDLPLLLVFGGSRGAHSINVAVAGNLPTLISRAQLLHVCGQADYAWLQECRNTLPDPLAARYRVEPYLHEDMAGALVAADLAISRAGASVLGELPAARLPAILVPYPHAGRHQEQNARYLTESGAAVMIDDTELARQLSPVVTELLANEARRKRMRQRLHDMDRPDAAQRIAGLLCELVKTK